MQDMNATYQLQSYYDVYWRNPRLDSNTAAHISVADAKAKKDYWIEVDLQTPATVYAVVLKRRADTTKEGYDANTLNALKSRANQRIKVQYLDVNTNKWVFYRDGEALMTGETVDTGADVET